MTNGPPIGIASKPHDCLDVELTLRCCGGSSQGLSPFGSSSAMTRYRRTAAAYVKTPMTSLPSLDVLAI